MGHYRHHRQQNMKIFTAGIILLLAGSGRATPQFKFNLGGLFGGVTVPRNNNNQENTNTNDPLQAAGSLFGGALEEILTNTDVRIGPDGIKVEVNQAPACPPLLGDPAPPGCNKTFADDGDIPCWDDTDCPNPRTCQNNICSLFVPQSGDSLLFAVGSARSYTRSDRNYLIE